MGLLKKEKIKKKKKKVKHQNVKTVKDYKGSCFV